MAKFRAKSQGRKAVNLAGGEAFKETPKLELVSLLLTSFVNDKFYESAGEQLGRLETLVRIIPDKRFVAKAAVYARTKFGMRSITHALIGELAQVTKGQVWMKNAIAKAVHRPDDMLEILAYHGDKYGKPIPNALKKGLAIALGKFDAYQLAKYRGERTSVKMVDLFNLVHPKPSEKNAEIWAKLLKGELKATNTWETKLTQAGQNAENEEQKHELKAQAWNALLRENKLGYFALLRNLRNIMEQAPDLIELACKQLVDVEAIHKSLVLPFRFSTAVEQIEALPNSRKVVEAIHNALEISLANVPKFDGRTLVVLDESGSMVGRPSDIGSLFAAVLYKSNDADLMTFSGEARIRNPDSRDSVLTIAKNLRQDFVGGGTNFHAIFETSTTRYNRIVILSDMQGWVGYDSPAGTFARYKAHTDSSPFIYSFDLNGYGTLQFPEPQVFCITGFSERIFEVMRLLERDRNALVNEIEKVELE